LQSTLTRNIPKRKTGSTRLLFLTSTLSMKK
jgi:hypothetical protein